MSTAIIQLRSRELNNLGVQGEYGEDYEVCRDTLEVKFNGAVLVENPELQVEVAKPGDVLWLYSNTTFAPDKTVGIVAVNPVLQRSGFVSAPGLLTERTAGQFAVLFQCVTEVDLTKLAYLAEVYSIGQAKQQGSKKAGDEDA